MAKNTLYNFLDLCVYKNKKLHMGNNVYLIKTQDKTNSPYFRFDLPIEKHIAFSLNDRELTISKHHISIYQDENSENPSLSQFHYSAYFLDQNNQEYVLHVFFNDHNQLTQLPVLSLITGDDKKINLEVDEYLSDQFITLAREKVDPIIAEVQRRKSEKIRQLQIQYEKDEQQASELSKDLRSNRPEYEVVVQRMIKTLNDLNQLFKHDSYNKIAKWLRLLIKPQLPPIKQTEKQATKTNFKKPELPEENTKSPSRSEKKPFKSSSKKSSSDSNIEAILRKSIEKFNILEKDNTRAVSEISDLCTEVNSLLLLSESGTELPKGFITKVNNLQLQINRRGTALLYSLIEHRNFELAKTLTPFHYNLDEKLLIQALEQADEHLLEFLLSCGEYTLDNQPLRIEGQTYKSAVHYCFNTCQKQSMAPCLSTLIRHGASLLGKGANGLPLAHTLLSTPNHPLLPALEANKPSTLQSRYFYVQLANLIQNFLMAGGMDDQRRKMLTKAMESYRETAGSFLLSRDLDKGRGNKLRQTVDQFKEEAKQKCSENVINQLEQELDSVLSNELRGHGSMSRMRRANQIFQAAAKFMQEDKIDTWNGQAADLRKLLGM